MNEVLEIIESTDSIESYLPNLRVLKLSSTCRTHEWYNFKI